mmetsp:Transcript_31431/g.90758  ORF Transcript_31431/g.90758 Transcript_31431/m.90758 type:complete len:204 (+) Transcript_31431:3155-3766(+)
MHDRRRVLRNSKTTTTTTMTTAPLPSRWRKRHRKREGSEAERPSLRLVESWRTTPCSPCWMPGRQSPTSATAKAGAAAAPAGSGPRRPGSGSATATRARAPGSTRTKMYPWISCPRTPRTRYSPCGRTLPREGEASRLGRQARPAEPRPCGGAACASRRMGGWSWTKRRRRTRPGRRTRRRVSIWAREARPARTRTSRRRSRG